MKNEQPNEEIRLTSEIKRTRSLLLRLIAKKSWERRSFVTFEKHLDVFENKSLPVGEREKAARKIDRMIYRRSKKYEQVK